MFGAMNSILLAASVSNMNAALIASNSGLLSSGIGYRGSSIEHGGPAGVWLGDAPKSAAPMSFKDFERLERAVRTLEELNNPGSYYAAQRDAKIENRIRTLMAAGVPVDEVTGEAEKRQRDRWEAEQRMHERRQKQHEHELKMRQEAAAAKPEPKPEPKPREEDKSKPWWKRV